MKDFKQIVTEWDSLNENWKGRNVTPRSQKIFQNRISTPVVIKNTASSTTAKKWIEVYGMFIDRTSENEDALDLSDVFVEHTSEYVDFIKYLESFTANETGYDEEQIGTFMERKCYDFLSKRPQFKAKLIDILSQSEDDYWDILHCLRNENHCEVSMNITFCTIPDYDDYQEHDFTTTVIL